LSKKSGSKKKNIQKKPAVSAQAAEAELNAEEEQDTEDSGETAAKQTKTPAKTSAKAAKKKGPSRAEMMRRFFAETKAEFGKIVWPGPKQVMRNTVVVLVMIVFVGAIIWLLDAGSTSLLNMFLKHYSS
jgi:preprotein translocase subunit SecE